MVMAGGMIKKLVTSTILGCGIFLAGGLASLHSATAQTTGSEVPTPEPAILFSADEVDYNQELQTVTTRGNVEISREGRILLADTVSYDRTQDVLTASGNVSITEPTGEVTFASYVELSGDFKEGIVQDIYVLLDENTRIAGRCPPQRRELYRNCQSSLFPLQRLRRQWKWFNTALAHSRGARAA